MKYHRFLWFSSKTQAMAVGHKCCEKGFKTYFLKASELNDKFTAALQDGQREKIILTSNVEPDKWIDFFLMKKR